MSDLLTVAAVALGGPAVSLALIVIHRLTAVDLKPTRSRPAVRPGLERATGRTS